MRRSVIGWGIALVLALGGSALAWVWFAGGSGEPSTELTTPPIASEATTTVAGPVGVAFVIDPSRSEASFEIDEELRGTPQRVVGTTEQIAGQVQVELSDLTTAQFSPILINVRTLQTDSERRDRAIRGPIILNSAADEFELVTFDVTSAEGLGGAAEVGETVEFSVTGDLTIKGVINEVGFDVTVTVVDETTISGTATTTVLRSDFGIGIPSVPGVANVGDEVALTLDFVAVAG